MKQISKPKFIEKLYTATHICSACGTGFQLEEGVDELKIEARTATNVDPDFIDQITRGNTDCLAIKLDEKSMKCLVEDMRFISENFKDYEGFNVYFPKKDVTYLTCKIKCPICGREKTIVKTIYGGNFLTGCYKVSYREISGADIAYAKNYEYLVSVIALGEDNKKDNEVLEKLGYTKINDSKLISDLLEPLYH